MYQKKVLVHKKCFKNVDLFTHDGISLKISKKELKYTDALRFDYTKKRIHESA